MKADMQMFALHRDKEDHVTSKTYYSFTTNKVAADKCAAPQCFKFSVKLRQAIPGSQYVPYWCCIKQQEDKGG